MPSGRGSKIFPSGFKYEGFFVNGNPTGVGKITTKSGVIIEW